MIALRAFSRRLSTALKTFGEGPPYLPALKDGLVSDLDYVRNNYQRISADEMSLLFDGMDTCDRIYLANSRILDYVLLRQAAHLDQDSMIRMLTGLIKLPISREAYSFPALSRLLQFKVHRLPLLDLLKLHQALDTEISHKWAQELRRALEVSIKCSDKSTLFKPRSRDVARLMTFGFDVRVPINNISGVPEAIDLLKAAWIFRNEKRMALLALAREFLLRSKLENSLQAFAILESLVPAQVPDLSLVDKAVNQLIGQGLTADERCKLLRLMRALSVFDERLLRFIYENDAESKRFRQHFQNCIPSYCVPSEESCPPKQTNFAFGICGMLKNDYRQLDEVDALISEHTNRGIVFLSKGDFVFGTKCGLVLSGIGQIKKNIVQKRLNENGKVLVVNCLELDIAKIEPIIRDICEWEGR